MMAHDRIAYNRTAKVSGSSASPDFGEWRSAVARYVRDTEIDNTAHNTAQLNR
jgi:hypothetical protein